MGRVDTFVTSCSQKGVGFRRCSKVDSVPKLIDHEERKQEIAHAVWQVLTREGVRGVSVRTVAAQAGISTGSLRHVFPSFEEMMLFSLDFAGKKFIRSLTNRQFEGQLLDNLEELYTYLSPVSEDGQRFTTVIAGMLADMRIFPDIAKILQEHEADFIYAYGFLLSQLRAHGFLKPGLDIDLEVEKLVALLWGINALYTLTDGEISTQELTEPIIVQFETLLNIFISPVCQDASTDPQEFVRA